MKIRAPQAPLAIGWALRRAREIVDPVALRRARTLGIEPAIVVPPRRLRARTGAPGIHEFAAGGRQAAQELSAALEATSLSLGHPGVAVPVGQAGPGSVLDFGCGPARVLPHVAALFPGAACTGADVDASAITWAVRHRPEHQWSVSPVDPPLPFAAESFDLVYSISVFSHMDERSQDAWLQEMHRLLRPGAVALLSVHGSYAFEQFRTAQVRSAWCGASAFARPPLSSGELVFEPYRRSPFNHAELPGVGDRYGLAFHGAGYVRERWPAALEVLEILERAMTGWQDIVVCRKARVDA